MKIRRAKIEELDQIMSMYKSCVSGMIEANIDQWDNTYPNHLIISEDIKNKSLIKYLSQPGIKVQLQKTENFYMQEQSKHMKKIDVELYFVIDEKNNAPKFQAKKLSFYNAIWTILLLTSL